MTRSPLSSHLYSVIKCVTFEPSVVEYVVFEPRECFQCEVSEGIRDEGWSLKGGLDSGEGRGGKAFLTGRGCRQRRIELGGSGGRMEESREVRVLPCPYSMTPGRASKSSEAPGLDQKPIQLYMGTAASGYILGEPLVIVFG